MQVLIPIIRKKLPTIVASELCSARPMTGNPAQTFVFRMLTADDIKQEQNNTVNGALRHDFLNGWERFFNGQWIPDAVYFKLKNKGVLVKDYCQKST